MSSVAKDEPVVTFMRSSQAQHWRFSAQQIEHMRIRGNEAASKRLEQIWQSERPASSSSSDIIDYTTVKEEQALIRYYLTRVHQLVKAFLLPEAVEATTITYIKRFYLRNTCMDYHPKNIMLTCLFLAAKAESNPIPLNHFAKKLAGKDASPSAIQDYFETVQKLEFLVSQSLDFEYLVHGAHRALHGLLLDISKAIQPIPSADAVRSLVDPARNHLKQSRFTDAELIYTPSQIALTCVKLASDTGRDMVEKYIAVKESRAKKARLEAKHERETWKQKKSRNGSSQKKEESYEESENSSDEAINRAPLGVSEDDLKLMLKEVEELVAEKVKTVTEDVELVKSIDKKLKLCQNPENLSNSRISHSLLREKEEAALGKRKNKSAKAGQHPFGDDEDDDDIQELGQGEAKRAKMDGVGLTAA
ncbi:hypothetical protein CBS101457_000584 [Exobasidium rhododendri]|nr:hypothetical protein CBS101457_000584 [Exobasidium rhododendri]